MELFCVILIYITLTWNGVTAPKADSEKSNEIGEDRLSTELRQFDNVIINFMRDRGIPGASVAVSKNGNFLLRKGYGRAGMYRIVTPWSIFRIGSVSKPITAVGILKLYEEERLKLNDKVFGPGGILSKYIPTSKGDKRLYDITVEHLLYHSGGWDSAVIGDPLVWRGIGKAMDAPEPADQDTIIRYMMSQPLQFNPGTKYAYCNFGYMVLGRIIEEITGKDYERYINDMLRKIGIFRMRLGHTRKEELDFSEAEYFSMYPSTRVLSVYPKDGLVPPPYGGFCMETMDSSGGWIASASDLVTFFDALNSTNNYNKLLKHKTFTKMLEIPQYAYKRTWYGMGLVVQDGGKTWWHSGMFDGATSILTHDDSGYTWAILMNYKIENNDLDDLIKYAIKQVPSWSNRSPLPPTLLSDSVISRNEETFIKLMIPEQKFHHIHKLISEQGYRMTWIDAFNDKDAIYFNTIWKKDDGTKWRAYHGLTSSVYQRRYKAKITHGYRLLQIETYVSNKKIRYAAIFVKDHWPSWVSYHGYSPHRHRLHFYKLLGEGYRLTVQAVTEFRGKLYISAIYDKLHLGEYRVRMGLTAQQYKAEFEKQIKDGRILSYVQAYQHGKGVKFSAIWAARTTTAWAAKHDMSKYTLLNKLTDYAEANVPLACVAGYKKGNEVSFVALWR